VYVCMCVCVCCSISTYNHTKKQVKTDGQNNKHTSKSKKQTKLIAELKQELLESRETIKALTTRCNELDDLQRCNNLRIDGLPEVDAETTEQTAVAVSSMLREKLELRELPLESAHRVGPVWRVARAPLLQDSPDNSTGMLR